MYGTRYQRHTDNKTAMHSNQIAVTPATVPTVVKTRATTTKTRATTTAALRTDLLTCQTRCGDSNSCITDHGSCVLRRLCNRHDPAGGTGGRPDPGLSAGHGTRPPG